MKKLFLLTTLLFSIILSSTYSQKGATAPSKSKTPTSSAAGCPLVVSIQDNNPTAVCSELLKTLVAITSPCTDTTAVGYKWSSSVGGVFSTSRTTTFNLPDFLVATPVTFTVWVIEGSDSLSANYSVTVKPRPSRPSLSPFGTILLCDNNAITLTSSACTGGSTTIWSNGTTGVNTISVPATGDTYFKVACEKNGCVSDSTAAAALTTSTITTSPTVTNRIICEGAVITAGNGLQAQLVNCNASASGTYTYTGGTVGYDRGYRSSGSVDPKVTVPSVAGNISNIRVSITWRKQKGGYENSCGAGDTESWPYHNETQFRIQSPSGKIITLVNTYTYGGADNPTVTTVFEDGASPVNFYSPPVSGTFAPAQPLSGFIGENPTGVWTLLPYDAVGKDPLCVSGFAVTFTADTQVGNLTWWDAPTGGNQVGTGSEFIPTNTTAGTYTYYAQGQCVRKCPSVRTPTTLTINPTPPAPVISVNVPEVSGVRNICGGESVTLTATGCNNGGTVKWNSSYNGTNFATGSPYTFVPSFSNSSNISQTFTAACEGTNICRSVVSNSLTINVKQKPAQPTILGPGNNVCVNSNVTLTASACSGGTLGWTGNRSGGSINFVLTGAVNIKVACTVNGCTSDSSNVYSITPLARPNAVTVNASQVQALCYGSSVNLSASTCAGTIKWTGNLSGSPVTVTPLASRSYKASCLGTNGCPSDSSAALNIIVLPKTKPTITGSTFICGTGAGIPVTLTATGCSGVNETVMWRSEDTGLTYTETISQTKTFRAICIRNGYCVSDSSDIFTVQYRNKPSQPTITPPQNTTICQGTIVSLTATACTGGTLGWTGGLSGQTVSVSPNTTKSYKVACLANGCLSDSSSAVMITVIAKPVQPTINQTTPTICAGQNTTLSVTPVNGSTYAWTSGLTGTSITVNPLITKTYKVASTINGCVSDSASVVVSINTLPNSPVITLGGDACTNTLPVKIWDNLISTPSGCSVKSVVATTDGGTFTVIQEQSAVKIAKLNSAGSILWSRNLNTSPLSGIPYINSAVQTSDGGYLLGGSIISPLLFGDANFLSKTNSSGSSTPDFWILKIDANGVTQWSKNFGGNNEDVIHNIEKASDGGYLLGGTTNSSLSYDVSESGSNKDFWTVKIDASGNKLWDKRLRPTGYVGNVYDLASIKETSDGGIILGSYGSNPQNNIAFDNFLVLKTNSLRVKEWEGFYNTSVISGSKLTSIAKTSDGGYLLGGTTFIPNDSYTKPQIIKINSLGIKQWDKIYVGAGGAEINTEVISIPSENNFLIGITSSSNSGPEKSENSRGSYDIWVIKIKQDGTRIWDKTLGGSQQDFLNKLAVDTNGGLVLGGFSASPASGEKTVNGPGAWYIKLASNCPLQNSVAICRGDSVNLKSKNCTGITTWSNGLTGSSIIVKPTLTTNYTATCTNSNGCVSPVSTAFVVTVTTPPIPTITPPTNSTICQGSNVTLSATGCTGGTYAWTGGLSGTSISVSPSVTRAYKVACTLNTCTSDSSSVVTINVTPAPVFSLNSNKTSICSGDTATLTVSGCTGTLLWSNGATTTAVIKVSPVVNTTYTATCTLGSCSANQSVSITALSTPNVTASGILECGQSVTLTANNVPVGSSIQWRKDGVDIVGATNNTLVINSAGSYDFLSYKVEEKLVNGTSSWINSVKFTSPLIGFMSKQNSQTGILKTTDGGNTWVNVYNSTANYNDITFISPLIGFAVGTGGQVIKTTDGGNTWVISQLNTTYTLSKIIFKDSNVGIIVGGGTANNDIVIYRTSNQGQTWTFASFSIPNITSNNLTGVFFVPNTSTVFAVGYDYGSKFLLKSVDDGVTWSNVSSNIALTSDPQDIIFTTATNGWVVGPSGSIQKTTNGGNTWQAVVSGSSNYLRKIQFIDQNVAYVGGIQTLLKTTNGGNNWTTLNVPSNVYTTGISFLNENEGWIGTYYGLYKYSTPQCPTTPKVMTNICCSTFETIKSGSWTDPTVWSCNRVPVATDDVIINMGHTITDNGNTIHAKTLNYRGGLLKLSTTTNFILR